MAQRGRYATCCAALDLRVPKNHRAQRSVSERPQLHRSLNDDMLVEVLRRIVDIG
jgi:hypothetical protein